jgi:hypothetical protein
MFIRNAWYIAAWADEIGETPLARRIGNEPVVLYRDPGDQRSAHPRAGARSGSLLPGERHWRPRRVRHRGQ